MSQVRTYEVVSKVTVNVFANSDEEGQKILDSGTGVVAKVERLNVDLVAVSDVNDGVGPLVLATATTELKDGAAVGEANATDSSSTPEAGLAEEVVTPA